MARRCPHLYLPSIPVAGSIEIVTASGACCRSDSRRIRQRNHVSAVPETPCGRIGTPLRRALALNKCGAGQRVLALPRLFYGFRKGSVASPAQVATPWSVLSRCSLTFGAAAISPRLRKPVRSILIIYSRTICTRILSLADDGGDHASIGTPQSVFRCRRHASCVATGSEFDVFDRGNSAAFTTHGSSGPTAVRSARRTFCDAGHSLESMARSARPRTRRKRRRRCLL
jgi:hypothetical protein